MADTAFQIQYRQEFIAGFEQHQSLLRDCVTTEAVIKGNQAVFLVADSGGAQAVTRGVNGLIPGRPDNLNQNTCTLYEWHDVPEKTGFNIFASQSDGKRIMQMTSMAVINRKMDQIILNELGTATQNTGNAQTASLDLVIRAVTILGNNAVPQDGNMFAIVSPAFIGYLMKQPTFTSADYVDGRPLQNNPGAFTDKPGYYNWMGIKWMTSNQIPGLGSSNEQCFMFHKSAIGHAINSAGMQTVVDYNAREDISWVRNTYFMGAKLLQNSGVLVMNHDASALVTGNAS